jgi:hypothetical protein
LFENAIEVMADEFEDSLDDLEFSSPSDSAPDELDGIDDTDLSDPQIEDIEVDGEGSSDLLDDVSDAAATL